MSNNTVMRGFPPAKDGLVTLGNWRQGPFNQWAFHHVREFLPTACIANDPMHAQKPAVRPVNLTDVSFDDGGQQRTIREMLTFTDNDACVVLHKGDVVFEDYANGMDASTQHILFSVSKSVTAMVAGVAVERGQLDADALITHYIPELSKTAYAGATVRHLLDMTTGIEFDEDYTATEGLIVRYREASGWNVRTVTEQGYHMREFLTEMVDKEKEHGGQFRYKSPNSDMLGWIIERATGERFVDYMSKMVWRPMGATRDAYITVDPVGAPRTAGGICATAIDLALFGNLILAGGKREGVQIIPEDWIRDTRSNGNVDDWNCGDYKDDYPDWEMRYRNKWYVLGGEKAPIAGIGIHGQFLFIDFERQMVCATFSSSPEAVDTAKEMALFRGFLAMAEALDADNT